MMTIGYNRFGQDADSHFIFVSELFRPAPRKTSSKEKRMFRSLIKAGLVLCSLILTAIAVTAQSGDISAEKRALIKELLTVTNARATSEAVLNSIMDQQQQQVAKLISETLLKRDGHSPPADEALRKKTLESAQRSGDRFRQLVKQQVDFAKLMEDISYSVYDKHFTEGELRDLITFYQSPTGRKSITVMPQLFADSMQKSSEILIPQFQGIIGQLMREEQERLATESVSLSPATSSTLPQPARPRRKRAATRHAPR